MRKSLKSYLWKAAVFFLLAVLIGFRPAHGANERLCREMTNLADTAIQMRLEGIPAYRAKRRADPDLGAEARQIWQVIVDGVYAVEKRALVGSNRADWLTRLYRTCVKQGEQL